MPIHAGRQFYKCGRRDGGCDFFLWADQAPSSGSTDFNHSTVTATTSSNHYGSSSSTTNYNTASNRQPSLLSVHRTRGRGGRGSTRGGTRSYRGSRNDQDQEGDHSGMGFGGFEPQARSDSNSDNRQTIVCNCGTEAVQRTVQKEGPNKGRQFFTCCKPRDDQCGFFEWADNVPSCYVKQTRGGSRGRGRGRGKGGAKSTESEQSFSTDGSTARKKRAPPTCSVCRQQGHTKRSCPQAKQLS